MRSWGSRYILEPPAEGDIVPPSTDDWLKLDAGDGVIDTEGWDLGVDGLVGVLGLGERSTTWTLENGEDVTGPPGAL